MNLIILLPEKIEIICISTDDWEQWKGWSLQIHAVKVRMLPQGKRTEGYKSPRYEYNEEDIDYIFSSEDYTLSFTDKIEIITQRLMKRYSALST